MYKLPLLLICTALINACVWQENIQRYTNPHIESEKHRFTAFLKTRFFGEEKWAHWPSLAHTIETTPADPSMLNQSDQLAPRVTWIGHSTVLVQYKGVNVLTDPIFSCRASPLSFAGPRRITPAALQADQLPRIDLVVISHNHYDHLDRASVRALGSRVKHWAVPMGLNEIVREEAGKDANVSQFEWWQSRQTAGFEVTATPSQHWSGRGLTDRFETLWASWLIQIDDFTFWFGGDTGYNDVQFAEIGRRYPGIDLGLIPIGAYAPRNFMKDMHVNPAEAVRIHADIGAIRSIGIHWGTFPLTAEAPDEPPLLLRKALLRNNISTQTFLALAIGETITLQWPRIDQ